MKSLEEMKGKTVTDVSIDEPSGDSASFSDPDVINITFNDGTVIHFVVTNYFWKEDV